MPISAYSYFFSHFDEIYGLILVFIFFAITRSRAKYEAILAKVPDVEPEVYDKIPAI